jgi:hypothetical protein
MADSPQPDPTPTDAPPDGGGLEGYRARYDHFRGLGMDHNAAQRAASNKAGTAGSDRPPRAPRGGRAAGARGGAAGKPRQTGLARTVREMTSTAGGAIALLDPYTGGVLIDRAADLGSACAKAADHDPRFRRALEGFQAGGVYGGLVVVGLSILVPILARWGLIPEPYGSRLALMLAPESYKQAAAQAAQAGAGPASPAGAGQDEPAPFPRAA